MISNSTKDEYIKLERGAVAFDGGGGVAAAVAGTATIVGVGGSELVGEVAGTAAVAGIGARPMAGPGAAAPSPTSMPLEPNGSKGS